MASPLDFVRNKKSSTIMRPFLNNSALFDMYNADFYKGRDGITYMNGGVTPNNLLSGGSNTQKTGFLVLSTANLLFRHPDLVVFFYDTESTFDVSRLAKRVDSVFEEDGYFYKNIFDNRFIYQCAEDGFDGNDLLNFVTDYEKKVSETLKKGTKAEKEEMFINTPFLDKDGSEIKMISPLVVIVDSLTDMRFKQISDKFQEGNVDDGGKKRMRDAEFGNLKRVVFEDCHTYGSMSGIKLFWVAQIVTEPNFDGKPQERKTTFLEAGKKLHKVPNTALQTPHIAYRIVRGSKLINQSDKEWEYPNPNGPDSTINANGKENPDLMKFEFSTIRNKTGQSDYRVSFIASQTEGIIEELSMYDNLKSASYFGLKQGGMGRNEVTLYPGESITRKNIRHKLKENKALVRAIEITYQLYYLQTTNTGLRPEYRMTVEELYQRIIDLGYDWKEILENTIYYWHTNPNIKKHTVCIVELLDIALGKTVPKYLTKTEKK